MKLNWVTSIIDSTTGRTVKNYKYLSVALKNAEKRNQQCGTRRYTTWTHTILSA